MDNKKFEQLIDLIINENEEQARELFHDIVVEKSREIYESIMDEEMMEEGAHGEEEAVEESMHDDMAEGDMVGEVGDLLDEINVEEAGGMTEEEEDLEVIDLDASDDMGAEAGEEMGGEDLGSISDKLDSLDDKLDMLMAEFEAEMKGDDAASDEEGEEEVEVDSEEEVMEAIQLQKVPGLYDSKIGGDDGANTKSPALHEPKVKAEGVKPVKFSGDAEKVPTSPAAPKNKYAEKEGTLIGDVANTPGMKKAPALKSAPKPVSSQASGVNNKSVVAKG